MSTPIYCRHLNDQNDMIYLLNHKLLHSSHLLYVLILKEDDFHNL